VTPSELAREQERINALAAETYVDPANLGEVITDGVIDPETYLSAPLRIMWFLKEPYCDGQNGGGGWCLVRDHFRAKPAASLGHHTFHPIIYLTHALLTGEHNWEKIPWVRDMSEEEAKAAIHSIAFINAKKLPGVTSGTDSGLVTHWFNLGREVIDAQIRAYAPQVIFGCQPHIPQIFAEAGLSYDNGINSAGSADYAWIDGRLYVHVYHPGNRRVKKRTYFEDALRAVVEGLKIAPTPSPFTLPMNPTAPLSVTVQSA
jgi:hypothetical protein